MQEIIIEIVKGIFWTVFGAVFGHFYTKYSNKKEQLAKVKEAKKALENKSLLFKQQKDIFALENGNPIFEVNDLDIRDSGKTLIIAVPDKFRSMLLENDAKFTFRNQVSFDGSDTLDELSTLTKITDIKERILKHSNIVAEDFIKRQNNSFLLFNGQMFGIYRINRNRTGIHENSELRIDTYRTRL